MSEIDLVAIVLQIRPLIDRPVEARNWYGLAAQSMIYDLIQEYSQPLYRKIHDIHKKDDADQARFTASTIFGSFPQGRFNSRNVYSLRFTFLGKDLTGFIDWAVNPCSFLSAGAVTKLTGIDFRIENIFLADRDHKPTYTSYGSLVRQYLNSPYNPPKLKIELKSPALFKKQLKSVQNEEEAAHDCFNPLLSTEMVYSSLQRKWEFFTHSKVHIDIYSFLRDHTRVNEYSISSQSVKIIETTKDGYKDVNKVGGKGFFEIETNIPWSTEWGYISLLTAFSFYSGIGLETTRGFGQVYLG